MAYLLTRYKKESRWICKCKRMNDATDLRCAFCREPKPTKQGKQKDPSNARIKSTRTDYNGMWFQSKLEANYARQLDFRIKAGEVKSWERQKKITIIVDGVKICNYFIDFIVTLPDGSKQYVEVKGMEQEVWRLKWKLVMALRANGEFCTLNNIEFGSEWIVVK